jgi:hypothetical protein
MIRGRFLIFAVASAAELVASAAFAAPNAQKLKTFGTGEVTLTGADSATIVNDAGEYGGVYVQTSKSSTSLDQVVLEFTSTADVQGGAPRFSIPIDSDGRTNTDGGFAFIDAAGCGGTVGTHTDNTWVSTENAACHVNYAPNDYANWERS